MIIKKATTSQTPSQQWNAQELLLMNRKLEIVRRSDVKLRVLATRIADSKVRLRVERPRTC